MPANTVTTHRNVTHGEKEAKKMDHPQHLYADNSTMLLVFYKVNVITHSS
jgi:hypothetical protein